MGHSEPARVASTLPPTCLYKHCKTKRHLSVHPFAISVCKCKEVIFVGNFLQPLKLWCGYLWGHFLIGFCQVQFQSHGSSTNKCAMA